MKTAMIILIILAFFFGYAAGNVELGDIIYGKPIAFLKKLFTRKPKQTK